MEFIYQMLLIILIKLVKNKHVFLSRAYQLHIFLETDFSYVFKKYPDSRYTE